MHFQALSRNPASTTSIAAEIAELVPTPETPLPQNRCIGLCLEKDLLSDIPSIEMRRHESHLPHLRRTTLSGVVWSLHIHWQVQLPLVGSGN